MPKPRGREHTTLTETATLVVKVLDSVGDIKMIAPGEIRTNRRTRGGKRHLTIVKTRAGVELLVTGQSVQRIAVHTSDPAHLIAALKTAKPLRDFTVKVRERKPGI
jgi:hypothetical protein